MRIEALDTQEALIEILRSSYNYILKDPKIMAEQFAMMADFVKRVPVKRLVYSSGFSRLPEVYQSILRDLNPV